VVPFALHLNFELTFANFSNRSRMPRGLAAGRFCPRCVSKLICLHGSPIAAVWRADNARHSVFERKPAPNLIRGGYQFA